MVFQSFPKIFQILHNGSLTNPHSKTTIFSIFIHIRNIFFVFTSIGYKFVL